jgi:hypothetical protein
MGRLGTMLVLLVLGAVILAPVVMALELDPMPGDFALAWNNQTYNVPVIWSLCASGALTLLYSLLKR